jgi:hypothetical protein
MLRWRFQVPSRDLIDPDNDFFAANACHPRDSATEHSNTSSWIPRTVDQSFSRRVLQMQNQNILRFLIFHCISRQNTSQMLWKGVIDTFMLHERHIDTRISCLLGPEICTLWVRLRARTQVGAFTPGQITSHYRRKRKLPIPRHAKRRGMHRNWLYEAFVRYRLRGIFCEMPYICISLSVSTLLSSPAFDLTNYYWCSSWAPMHCFSPCVVLCARLPELTTAYACMRVALYSSRGGKVIRTPPTSHVAQ